MKNLLKLANLNYLYLSIVIFTLDLISKYAVINNFTLEEIVPLLPSLNLCYIRNYGLIFSFFSSKVGWYRWLFVIINILACIIILFIIYKSEISKKLNNFAYALIFGGALGNLFDRLWYGFVIDIIDFYLGNWHFATFNIADSAIFIGSILIVLGSFYK